MVPHALPFVVGARYDGAVCHLQFRKRPTSRRRQVQCRQMPIAQNNETIAFGPFRLNLAERLLTRNGVRVELRGRAYDLLVALLSRPNEIISKSDLLRQVWPGLVV